MTVHVKEAACQVSLIIVMITVTATVTRGCTVPETIMETHKGPMKTRVLLKWDYLGVNVSLGECIGIMENKMDTTIGNSIRGAARTSSH